MGVTHFDLTAPHIIVRVRLLGPRGVEWADLILDTGATHTVVDELITYRLGYDTLTAPKVSLATVSGTTQASVITVRQLFALGETVSEFEILAMPLPIQLRADGLLGLDFLRRRNLFCNFDKGLLLTLPFARNLLHRLTLTKQIFTSL
ncbi:MAG: retroviral-like aspartic protease family protein [Armatimonadetes bacterium]|nr:retroviral-like aspartic protease family protein [Armatimonadota bacterium]MDW8027597.1 retropepsin-like aspartic protease [Armatimonadota bacterium]